METNGLEELISEEMINQMLVPERVMRLGREYRANPKIDLYSVAKKQVVEELKKWIQLIK